MGKEPDGRPLWEESALLVLSELKRLDIACKKSDSDIDKLRKDMGNEFALLRKELYNLKIMIGSTVPPTLVLIGLLIKQILFPS